MSTASIKDYSILLMPGAGRLVSESSESKHVGHGKTWFFREVEILYIQYKKYVGTVFPVYRSAYVTRTILQRSPA